MKSRLLYRVIAGIVISTSSVYSIPPPGRSATKDSSRFETREAAPPGIEPTLIDLDSYIDANKLLMFVTNAGSIAYDRNAVFSNRNDGLYYPFTTVEDMEGGVTDLAVVFAAGIWIGGVDSLSGDTLISVAEYSNDYWPGPMVGGSFIPGADTDPAYRVFKLFRDSLADNPNQDYLDWPIDQGAPFKIVDSDTVPDMKGDQTLWAVYNDANPAIHDNDASTDEGLGVEIQQTVWAFDQAGNYELPVSTKILVYQLGSSDINVNIDILNPLDLTRHDYLVVTDSVEGFGFVWHLIDITTDQIVLTSHPFLSPISYEIVDGLGISVSNPATITSFEVVANASGPLNPPEAGAFRFQGFPTPDGSDISAPGNPSNAQQVGDGHWAFHTGDNSETGISGTRGDYNAFIERTFRGDPARMAALGAYDWEMRFTGSNSNPGAGGGWAWAAFTSGNAFWVPFELWRIGIATPDDPADDVRIIPWIFDDGGDSLYYLSAYGSVVDVSCGPGGCEHSASSGNDDPYTDWVYWIIPADDSPGEAGYLEFEAAMLSDPLNWPGDERAVMDRTVLINWNGGVQPPFNQDLPEQGTVFRIVTGKSVPIDTFAFTAAPPGVRTTGPEGVSVYVKYKLINKSSKHYKDFFISFWTDPDLGDAGDDFAGCDTLQNMHFCYNDGTDSDYGSQPPAYGVKLIEGPITPSPVDTAYVDGLPRPDYRNVGMYSFFRWIGSDDPPVPKFTYEYMNGLDAWSPPPKELSNGSRFQSPGDPVAGTGELDANASDRRMFATFGPITTFAPGDTQQVVLKLAVGRGSTPLNSITVLKEILNYSLPECADTDYDEVCDTLDNCPITFNPTQADSDQDGIGDVCDEDRDGDGILEDGDSSGTAGDFACSGGATADCDDNCPDDPNPSQADSDADGIGDICECCIGITGNTDGDEDNIVDIGDLAALVDYLFISFTSPPCLEEANCDGSVDGLISIGDLTTLIDYLFINFSPPAQCR